MIKHIFLCLALTSALACGNDAGDADQTNGNPTIIDPAPGYVYDGSCDDTLEPRSEMLGVFDPLAKLVVFYGGDDSVPVQCAARPHPVGGTWIYNPNCGGFNQVPESINIDHNPGGRTRAVVAYDSKRHQMLIFGGRFRTASSGTYDVFNDVWALDLTHYTWKPLLTRGDSPSPRSNSAGAYDAIKDRLIIYGGNSSNNGLMFGPLPDAWEFDIENQTWNKLTTQGAPPKARLFHTAVIDDQGKNLYIHGGGGSNAFIGPFYGDLWQLNLNSLRWTLLADESTADAPLGTIWGSMVWDTPRQRIVLFAGHDTGDVGNNNGAYAWDVNTHTWSAIYAAETVNNAPPAGSFCDFSTDFTIPNKSVPERRSAQLAVLDESRGEWIIIGGKTDCGLIDDIWTLDLTRDLWQRQKAATVGETCLRSEQPDLCLAMCQ